ncbi:MAG TPA: sugar ABC transporter permease, partial [Thalassospira sp.]|nr:sugar ABC transporter permease [Thalassospira sp.]
MAEPAPDVLQRSEDRKFTLKSGKKCWRPQWSAGMALIPAMTITIVCFYGFIIWTFVISLTRSRLLPVYKFTGFEQYVRLFANERWWTAMQNLAIHGFLFIGGSVVFG